jgi:hypothetical protein
MDANGGCVFGFENGKSHEVMIVGKSYQDIARVFIYFACYVRFETVIRFIIRFSPIQVAADEKAWDVSLFIIRVKLEYVGSCFHFLISAVLTIRHTGRVMRSPQNVFWVGLFPIKRL